jgi:hypothetical protein
MNNINRPLSEEWYSSIQKKKNKKSDVYFADACDLSRNHHETHTSRNKNVKNIDSDMLPLSGSEPHYDPEKWNNNYFDRLNHNCYAYVLDDYQENRSKRPQPGHRDREINTFRKQDYTREEISRRAIYDNPSIYCTDPKGVCKKGYYKGVLVIDRYNNYHWLRQDSNGYWSHKPGQLEVTNIDADGKLIKDPSKANLVYDKDGNQYKLLYTDIGPYYCIPNKSEGHVNVESHTCGQCGGSIRANNKNGICYKCRH